MNVAERKLNAVFFRTDQGNKPVREWLLSLTKAGVRPRLRDRIGRVIFIVDGQTMVLLHGFIKKTRKTPKHELDLAMKRKNQLL